MPRNPDQDREKFQMPPSHEVGPGPTPGKAEGAEGPFQGYPNENEIEPGPGPTPGNAEGEPDHVNEDLGKQV